MNTNQGSQPTDSQARLQALDTAQSFCVQAPAGSGKTELLTQRILSLLASCQAPEEILAFTFTRKAAGEMRERLLNSLQQAALMSTSEIAQLSAHKRDTYKLAHRVLEQDASHNWQLLDNPRRLRITTIDSFNHGLTAQLPLRASMGAAANITTDMGFIYSRAIRSLFSSLESTGTLADNLKAILGHLHNNLEKAESLFALLLEKRDQWLPLVMQLRARDLPAHNLLAESLDTILCEQLQHIQYQLQEFLPEILRLVRFTSGHLAANPDHPNHALAEAGIPTADPDCLPLWRTLVNFLLTSSMDAFRKPAGLKIGQGFPAKSSTKDKELIQQYDQAKLDFGLLTENMEQANMLALLQDLAMLPDPLVADEQAPVLNAVLDVLPLLAVELDYAMREAGQVDFTQTTLAALQALGSEEDPSELALKLDYRLQHILVDEFQDTSSVQFRLLELLTRGWQPGDGRTLFVVGDGMQSCYGFRNARVSLFMQAREQGIGDVALVPLDLEVNFRSDAAIVNCVNAVFSKAFPAQPDLPRGGVVYSHSQPQSAVPTSSGVNLTLWPFTEAEPGKAARQQAEARAIAQRILLLQAEDPERSIAILVRYRSHLKAIVPTLREHGLKFNATEIDPLLSYPEISDLFVMLRAVLNVADSPAWFALLRSPMVGLQLEDVKLLAENCNTAQCSLWTAWQQPQTVDGLSEDARLRLDRTVAGLHHARRLHQQWTTRLWLETLWLTLGGPACISNETVLPNVDSFFQLVEQYDEPGQFNLAGFTQALEKAHGSVTEADVNLTIQTIHKAKGLEYDAVIIPGLHRAGSNSDAPLLHWNEYIDANNLNHPVFALAPQKGANRDRLYDYLKSEANLRERLEATRLLYIAVTRAVSSAWLYAEIKQDNKGLSAPKNTLLATISHLLESPPSELKLAYQLNPETASAKSSNFQEIQATQTLLRLPSGWSLPNSASVFPATPDALDLEAGDQQLLVRQIGELVHLGLKALSEQGPQWLDTAWQLPLFKSRLAPLCADSSRLQAAMSEVKHHLQTCLNAPIANWLLFQAHDQAACELALVDFRQGYRRDYSVDRTFVDKTGERWIIDYKSSRPLPGQDLQDFLLAESAHYSEQLATYASLFKHEQRPVHTALFFTALALLHEVSLASRMDIGDMDGYAHQRPLFGPED